MKAYLNETITSTDLARNLAGTIDKIRLSGHAIDITKGNQIVARLVPAAQKGLPMEKIESFFQNLPSLDPKDKQLLANDLKTIRDNASLLDTPWE